MTKATHTPGPWTAYIYMREADDFGLEQPEEWRITWPAGGDHWHAAAYIGACPDEAELAECEANARLIAAAPDLLEALKKACAVLAGETMNKNALIDALEASRSAIKRATGDTQ